MKINNIEKYLTKNQKILAKMIAIKEGDGGLSHSRFVQATITNWIPKAIMARSLADFSEITFLEVFESALFFYLPSLMGEYLSRRKIFSRFLPKNLKNEIAKPVSEVLKNKNAAKILPVKAAIVLSCAIIPAAEYALSFAKNLFTLKVFKKADFSNVANLNKNQKELPENQKSVEKSAKNHIKKSGIIASISFGLSLLLGSLGQKSKIIQKICPYILTPGVKINAVFEKIGVKSKNLKNFLEKYLNFDFKTNSKGHLILSEGQLAATVTSGFFGYFAAAKDRGKLDVQEVATRMPVIALYTIFGSTLLEKIAIKKESKISPEIIKFDKQSGNYTTANINAIYDIAKKRANDDEKVLKAEIQKYFKSKVKTTLKPFAFSLGIIGLALSLLSRILTKYRYKNSQKNAE